MKYRHGLLLSAVLLLVAGCDSGVTTTQTSMMRGPTPSSGMTVPRLLTASAPPDFSGAAESEPSSAEADTSAVVDPSGAESTEEIAPPEGSDAQPLPSDTQAPPPDDVLVPSESVPAEVSPPVDPGTAVDLGALAASFGCNDYFEYPAAPPEPSYGECQLGENDEPVQLYGFATDEEQGAFIEQLAAGGMTVEQFVQGQRYIVIPGPEQLAAVKAALTPG